MYVSTTFLCVRSLYLASLCNYLADINLHLHYKRVDLYLWNEYAPVLECSESRCRYPRKGTSVDRVCVIFVARDDRRIVYCSSKTDSCWEQTALKVTACHCNNTGCWQEYSIVSVQRIARTYAIHSGACQTHTHTRARARTHARSIARTIAGTLVYIELDGGRQAGRE